MTVISELILLPTMLKTRATYLERREDVREVPLGTRSETSAVAGPAIPAEVMPRIILTLDGEEAHLNATMTHIVDSGLAATHKIEIVKFAASASKIQQPSDVGPCYRCLKQALKLERPPIKAIYSSELAKMLARIDAASRRTFTAFLEDLPARLSKAFHSYNVQKGWQKSGLYPFNTEQMLSQSSDWSSLSLKEARAVRRTIPELTNYAFLHGEVRDEKLQECFGKAMRVTRETLDSTSSSNEDADNTVGVPARCIKRSKMSLDELVLNRRRALWLNHQAITDQRKLREKSKMAAATKKPVLVVSSAAEAANAIGKHPMPPGTSKGTASAGDEGPIIGRFTPMSGMRVQRLECANPNCLHRLDDDITFEKCLTCAKAFCNTPRCRAVMECHKMWACSM